MNRSNSAFLTDLYQLTMAQAYLEQQMDEPAVFDSSSGDSHHPATFCWQQVSSRCWSFSFSYKSRQRN